MPRPKTLTNDLIAAAALAVIDRDGLAALSMRTVAAELDVGAMSLYRYVRSREELERLVIARALGGIDTKVSPRASWQARVTTLAVRARDAMRLHPSLIPIVVTRTPATAVLVEWGEQVLAALAAGGVDGRDAAIALRTIIKYVFGAVQLEHFGPTGSERTGALAVLPADRFPHLARAAAAAIRITPDEEFRKGLDIVLAGIAAG
jgi:AcrR family transcriptional regulator